MRCQRLGEAGLADPGYVFHQQVALGQDAHQGQPDGVVLTPDHPTDVTVYALERLGEPLEGSCTHRAWRGHGLLRRQPLASLTSRSRLAGAASLLRVLPKTASMPRLGAAHVFVLARHPELWLTAARVVVTLAPAGWWRRWPFLPIPDSAYLAFRLETLSGRVDALPAPSELVAYLEWCRRSLEAPR
jgi:hypothetical protein